MAGAAGLYLPRAPSPLIRPRGQFPLILPSRVRRPDLYRMPVIAPWRCAVAFVDSGAAVTQATGTTHTAVKPVGSAAGELLVFGIVADDLATFTPPTGWTLVREQAAATFTRLAVFWADGAVSALGFTLSASVSSASRMRRYTGHDAAAPINVSGGVATSASIAPVDAPSVTPTVTDTMLVTFHAKDFQNLTWTTPAGMGNVANANSGAGVFASLSSFDLLRTDMTATGIRTSTASAGDGDGAGIALCIKPAAGGAPAPRTALTILGVGP